MSRVCVCLRYWCLPVERELKGRSVVMFALRSVVHRIRFILLLQIVFTSATYAKTLIIFAPHPDDEALMASGIMYSALARGDTVKGVLMTNGDAGGPLPSVSLGTSRQGETVTCMSPLVLFERKILFLRYPHHYQMLRHNNI